MALIIIVGCVKEVTSFTCLTPGSEIQILCHEKSVIGRQRKRFNSMLKHPLNKCNITTDYHESLAHQSGVKAIGLVLGDMLRALATHVRGRIVPNFTPLQK